MLKIRFYFGLIAALGCITFTKYAVALNWNDPGVTPVQSISDHRWRDANTGQFINVAGMPGIIPPTTSGGTPTPTSTTTPTGTPTTTGTTAPAPTKTSTKTSFGQGVKNNWAAKSTAGKVGSALAVVGGATMIYGATAGEEEHNAGNVVAGVAGGAMAGASLGSIIPGVGTAIGAAGGAIIGGVIAGSQLFSETDCLRDPVTGLFTCCNTFFTNGQRNAKIGEYMFCANEKGEPMAPGVRQCLQGDSDTELPWWKGLLKDDHWTPECKPRMCQGESEPAAGMTQYVFWVGDTENICYKWICVDGYKRNGNKCIATSPSTPNQPSEPSAPTAPDTDAMWDEIIQKIVNTRNIVSSQCATK